VLNLLSLNCCGLKSKLNYPEFHAFVNTFDILCFVESKTDDLNEIVLPGFLIKMKNRKIFQIENQGELYWVLRKNMIVLYILFLLIVRMYSSLEYLQSYLG
jgi:hypothetical protein